MTTIWFYPHGAVTPDGSQPPEPAGGRAKTILQSGRWLVPPTERPGDWQQLPVWNGEGVERPEPRDVDHRPREVS